MRCPRCSEEIDYLNNYQPCTTVYTFRLEDGNRPIYEEVDVLSNEAGEYECPECTVVLASDEETAIAFLKGEISDEMAQYYMELAVEGKGK